MARRENRNMTGLTTIRSAWDLPDDQGQLPHLDVIVAPLNGPGMTQGPGLKYDQVYFST
jgi:hypothetical protein